MITEHLYIDYIENLAIQSLEINHTHGGKKSFAYVEDGDDLDEFDEQLRNAAQSPFLLLVAESGELDDNESENHTQELEGQIYVIAQKRIDLSVRQARQLCLPILVNLLARMKVDARKHLIVPGKQITFRINKVPYQKVGPINLDWYGYTAWFRFTCPFGFSVSSAIWRDIT